MKKFKVLESNTYKDDIESYIMDIKESGFTTYVSYGFLHKFNTNTSFTDFPRSPNDQYSCSIQINTPTKDEDIDRKVMWYSYINRILNRLVSSKYTINSIRQENYCIKIVIKIQDTIPSDYFLNIASTLSKRFEALSSIDNRLNVTKMSLVKQGLKSNVIDGVLTLSINIDNKLPREVRSTMSRNVEKLINGLYRINSSHLSKIAESDNMNIYDVKQEGSYFTYKIIPSFK